jgi:hypothetical protein
MAIGLIGYLGVIYAPMIELTDTPFKNEFDQEATSGGGPSIRFNHFDTKAKRLNQNFKSEII